MAGGKHESISRKQEQNVTRYNIVVTQPCSSHRSMLHHFLQSMVVKLTVISPPLVDQGRRASGGLAWTLHSGDMVSGENVENSRRNGGVDGDAEVHAQM